MQCANDCGNNLDLKIPESYTQYSICSQKNAYNFLVLSTMALLKTMKSDYWTEALHCPQVLKSCIYDAVHILCCEF